MSTSAAFRDDKRLLLWMGNGVSLGWLVSVRGFILLGTKANINLPSVIWEDLSIVFIDSPAGSQIAE